MKLHYYLSAAVLVAVAVIQAGAQDFGSDDDGDNFMPQDDSMEDGNDLSLEPPEDSQDGNSDDFSAEEDGIHDDVPEEIIDQSEGEHEPEADANEAEAEGHEPEAEGDQAPEAEPEARRTNQRAPNAVAVPVAAAVSVDDMAGGSEEAQHQASAEVVESTDQGMDALSVAGEEEEIEMSPQDAAPVPGIIGRVGAGLNVVVALLSRVIGAFIGKVGTGIQIIVSGLANIVGFVVTTVTGTIRGLVGLLRGSFGGGAGRSSRSSLLPGVSRRTAGNDRSSASRNLKSAQRSSLAAAKNRKALANAQQAKGATALARKNRSAASADERAASSFGKGAQASQRGASISNKKAKSPTLSRPRRALPENTRGRIIARLRREAVDDAFIAETTRANLDKETAKNELELSAKALSLANIELKRSAADLAAFQAGA